MKKEYILFIDSGIGGISTLAETMKIHNFNYLYFADNLHCPYGSHSREEIRFYLKDIIINLSKKYSFKIVVLACNTATASSISYLRSEFSDLIFIGIEPAVHLLNSLEYKRPLVIATPTTICQKKYLNLISSVEINIKTLALSNLAINIELFLTKNNLKNKVNLLKDIFLLKKISTKNDCIILGCTHYSLIKDLIKKYIFIPLIDGNYGVSKNIKKYSELLGYFSNKTSLLILSSKNQIKQKQKYLKILEQILAKE